jgi:hypothetical protein
MRRNSHTCVSAGRDGDQHLSGRAGLDGGVRGRRVLEAVAMQQYAGLLADPEGAVAAWSSSALAPAATSTTRSTPSGAIPLIAPAASASR